MASYTAMPTDARDVSQRANSREDALIDEDGVVQRSKAARVAPEDHDHLNDDDSSNQSNEDGASTLGGGNAPLPSHDVFTLETDVYTHFLLESLRKGRCHEKKWRAGVLVFVAVMIQLSFVWVLLRRCMKLHEAFDTALNDARTPGGSLGDANKAAIDALCGKSLHDMALANHGYTLVFSEHRTWELGGEIKCMLDQFRFMLRADFKLIFALVTCIWTMRIISEFRQCAWSINALVYFSGTPEADEDPEQEVFFIHDQDEGDRIVDMPKGVRMSAIAMQFVRLTVCVAIFACGVYILSATTAIIDIILNSLAFEFIFTVDELVVEAMASKRDKLRMESLGELHFFTDVPWFHARGGAVKRSWWVRLIGLFFVVFSCVYAHHLNYHSYFTRSVALCMTSGLSVDGSHLEDGAPVVFEARGFCKSFAVMYSNGEGRSDKPFECTASKNQLEDLPVRGSCGYPGSLTTAYWHFATGAYWSDYELRDFCLTTWFGRGVPKSSKTVPVLADVSQAVPIPREFGCLKSDLEITETTRYFPLLLPWEGVKDVKFNCKQPAYGPESTVWGKTPLDSQTIVPAHYFYKYDVHSPIEHQVGACAQLKKDAKRSCNHDDCDVLANVAAGESCNDICKKYDLQCINAADEVENSCVVDTSVTMTCADTHDTSDLLCKCRVPAATRTCGLLSDVWRRCPLPTQTALDPCSVLVNSNTSKAATCDAYCRTANLVCQSAYASKPFRCDTLLGLVPATCQTPFIKSGEPEIVCVCKGVP